MLLGKGRQLRWNEIHTHAAYARPLTIVPSPALATHACTALAYSDYTTIILFTTSYDCVYIHFTSTSQERGTHLLLFFPIYTFA